LSAGPLTRGGQVKRAALAVGRRRRPGGFFPVPRVGTRVATGACDEHNEKRIDG
jgi:hypothetical protein